MDYTFAGVTGQGPTEELARQACEDQLRDFVLEAQDHPFEMALPIALWHRLFKAQEVRQAVLTMQDGEVYEYQCLPEGCYQFGRQGDIPTVYGDASQEEENAR